MPAPFEIQVLSIDPVSWTPVTVAFDCNSLSVKNTDPANPVKFRTNVASAATEDTLGPGAEQALAIPFHRYRFTAGAQPLWLKATVGTGPVIVTFLA
ncbi:MAG: hypothetical protein EXQ47_07670 [Bryobacterales bacterium]|nr:hypothetical protein [Bryobacterales bacterium]